MAICLLFRLPVAHPCWTRVSLGLTSRRTNKLDVGCPSGARTQDTAVNSRMLVPTELRGNIGPSLLTLGPEMGRALKKLAKRMLMATQGRIELTTSRG